jgi:hypothetical protein
MESAPPNALLQKINVTRILTLMFTLKIYTRWKQQGNSGGMGAGMLSFISAHDSLIDTAWNELERT